MKILSRLAACLTLCALSFAASAQGTAAPAWPGKPLRIVIPYGPGSSPDVLARLLGERLTARLGQAVLVENRASFNISIMREHSRDLDRTMRLLAKVTGADNFE